MTEIWVELIRIIRIIIHIIYSSFITTATTESLINIHIHPNKQAVKNDSQIVYLLKIIYLFF